MLRSTCYPGVLGRMCTHGLTHTHTGKGQQVLPRMWGTTSLSHSPWMCSCAQGFSNLERSQSISLHLSLPHWPVYRQMSNWQSPAMVSVGDWMCAGAWCSGGGSGFFFKFLFNGRESLCTAVVETKLFGNSGAHTTAQSHTLAFAHILNIAARAW